MVADRQLIVPLNRKSFPLSAGNKALNLQRLSKLGLMIPKTFVIPWGSYQRYLQDDVSLVDELQQALSRCLDPNKAYAVRSSANIEDSVDFSFAGQFKSVLNQHGVEFVLQAIWSVWATARSERVDSYLEQHGIDNQDLSMGVIVQEMVPSVYAGVALSRNPVTGADEVIVEAVEGLGESLVQGGVTPYRWVNKWGTWLTKPMSTDIPLSLVEEIVAETRRISTAMNAYVDLEWAYDGSNLIWLQTREITTIHRHNVYSNHISKEMVPGLIKPLIGSINIPLVCSMWVRLLTEILGKTSVLPKDLAKTFYYRVYFNMGTLGQIFQEVGMPADSVETLMGLVPDDANKPAMKPTLKTFLRLPYMLFFLVDKWFFSRKIRPFLTQIEERFGTFDFLEAAQLSPEQLLEEIDRLYQAVQEAAYYNIVGPLLTMMYNRSLKSQLRKIGVNWMQFDLMAGEAKRSAYDPNYALHRLHSAFCQLDPTVQEDIRSGSFNDFLRLPRIPEFQKDVKDFLQRFGHLSDNGNDFSFVPWRETPNMVLDMMINFLPAPEDGQSKIQFSDLRLRGVRRWLTGIFYRRARDYHLFRDQISYYYTYGYGLFRYYYLALGSHLVQSSHIEQPQDVFYLDDLQVRQLIQDPGTSTIDARKLIAQHKADIERFRDISLPAVIYGDQAPPISDPSMEKLVGVPASIGSYTGTTVVVRGVQDFVKVQSGDVLVIPYSEVSWTSLFVKAGAVIAESGGLLSHSSIVAREYNIPAVVSVDGAMRLGDQVLVTVNGHTGEVFIHETGLGKNGPQEMEQ
jgi:phosphohistidine swiveling domain-containing protein